MCINQAREWTIATLSFGRNSKQIFVARKQNPAQLSGTVKQRRVVAFRTYLRSLLYAMGHHLDYALLGLRDSYHSEGFYKLESSLL